MGVGPDQVRRCFYAPKCTIKGLPPPPPAHNRCPLLVVDPPNPLTGKDTTTVPSVYRAQGEPGHGAVACQGSQGHRVASAVPLLLHPPRWGAHGGRESGGGGGSEDWPSLVWRGPECLETEH